MLRILDDLGGAPDLDDPTEIHHGDPVGIARGGREGSKSYRASPEQVPQMSRRVPPACPFGLLDRHLPHEQLTHHPHDDLDSPDDEAQRRSRTVTRQLAVTSKDADEDLGKWKPRQDDQQDSKP